MTLVLQSALSSAGFFQLFLACKSDLTFQDPFQQSTWPVTTNQLITKYAECLRRQVQTQTLWLAETKKGAHMLNAFQLISYPD